MSAGSVLGPAGPAARVAAEMAWVLIVGATLVFGIVMALLAAALLRRRRSGGSGVERWWIIGGGIAFPAFVLGALLVYAALRGGALALPHDSAAPVVSVTARLWWWQVQVHDPARGIAFTSANEIHLPVGRSVTLGLTSADVIHSFWVPALAGKVDMFPGRTSQLRLQADAPGVYRGQCAEFCGAQHARMALHVVAHALADYERWLAAQALPAVEPVEPQAQRGRALFERLRCNACHAVRGLVPGGGIGPDLTHVGSRIAIAAGTLPTSRAAFAQWVARSDHVKPGVRMPGYADLDVESLQALAAFLDQLR